MCRDSAPERQKAQSMPNLMRREDEKEEKKEKFPKPCPVFMKTVKKPMVFQNISNQKEASFLYVKFK